MATQQQLLQTLDALLQPERFRDYGPNGLQVEGQAEVRRVVSGVTASRALIEAAIEVGADCIFVHHGLFWSGLQPVTKSVFEKHRLCIENNLAIYSAHLPLDAHPELGNNAQLGRVLGFAADARFGEQDLGFAAPAAFDNVQAVADHVAQLTLNRPERLNALQVEAGFQDAREIVATAIAVVNAEPYRVREIIATAQNVLPWRQAEIASAANLASIPAAVALVEPQVAMPEFEVRRALVAAAPEETPVEEVRRAEVPEIEVRRAIVETPKSTKKRRK